MFAKIGQLSIYYQTVGYGKDLVFLHGWKQNVSNFWPIIDLLKKDFKLWLIDLPGFGRSDMPQKPLSIGDYAKIVADFISENHIKNPILLGHSLGGNVAIKLAGNYPNLISKLILEDSSGIRPKQSLKNIPLLLVAKLIKFLIPNIFNFKEKLRAKFYTAIGSDYLGADKLRDTFVKIVNEDMSTDARKITVPTLIIWGEKDLSVPLERGRKLYHLIKNSKLEVIESAGHFPHLENPSRFIYYVKDFC